MEKPPIWEVWRSIWGDMGTLEAIADALPDCPAGAILRGHQEHGLPEILPDAEKALREAGLEPDEEASRKTFRRGYQITTLLTKAKRREFWKRLASGGEHGPFTRWWDRHPAAYIHAGMHGAAQLVVFPWWAAFAIGVTHLLIDTRVPVAWWSKLIRQTQPSGEQAVSWREPHPLQVMDIGADVRIWADQVWHIGVIALLALVVA